MILNLISLMKLKKYVFLVLVKNIKILVYKLVREVHITSLLQMNVEIVVLHVKLVAVFIIVLLANLQLQAKLLVMELVLS